MGRRLWASSTRTALAARAGLVGLVLLVGLLGLVGLVGSGPSAAANPSASPSRIPDGPTTRFVVVDHNTEKRRPALRRALAAAERSDAQVVTLQEICGWQVAELRTQHPDWTIAYGPEHEHLRCLASADRVGATGEGRSTIGNATIWTGGPSGEVLTPTFTAQRSAADRTGLACVRWRDGAVHRACSVHLIAPVGGDQIRVRTRQAADVAALARRWIARGELVVLGGDFNAEPGRETMVHLYREGGRGDFVEASGPQRRALTCGCHRVTLPARRVKIDYVFFSTNRTASNTPRRLRTLASPSDHDVLIGWARVDASRRR